MKGIIVLTLCVFSSLMGCQTNAESFSTSQSASDEVDAVTNLETAVNTSIAENEHPSTAEMLPHIADNVEQPIGSTANANVLFVSARLAGDGTWTFSVTVDHDDMGWEDYADGWDIVLPDGEVIKPDPESPYTRLLLHPHEAEQPFTRSQSGIKIPVDIEHVTVRAHDLVDGFGGQEVMVDLAAESGPGFEVVR